MTTKIEKFAIWGHSAAVLHVFLSFLIATILTGLSYGLGMEFGWIKEVNWLEAFAVWTTYSCTYLCVFQSRINYPIGAISIAAFCILYYQQNLLASMALQIYLFPIMLYGWFRWGPDASPRPVTNLGWDKWTLGYVVITALAYATAYATNLWLGGSNAALDVFVCVGSILAQFLMDNKKLENWYVWLAVDVVSVYLLWISDLKVTAFQMLLFILNALWGLYEWKKTQNEAIVQTFWRE